MKADPTKSIPTRNSKAEEWIEWHRELKSNFGKKQANAIFLKAWKLRGSNSITTNEMRTYFSKNGITLDKSIIDALIDKGDDISDFFGDLFNIGKYAGIGLAIIVVGGLGLVVYNIAKNPSKAVGTTIKYIK